MNELFSAGDEIYGFCNGFFGRDDYQDKVCILVNSRYAVFQYIEDGLNEKGNATVLNHIDRLDKKTVEKWKIRTKT